MIQDGAALLPCVGVDLVQVASIRDSLAAHGERYLQRVYTEAELEYCRRSASELPRRLAARFAAKEATLKLLRPEGYWLDWRLIEVQRSPQGHCRIALHGAAALLATRRGLGPLSVSLSHEAEMAVAVVMGLAGTRADDSPSAEDSRSAS